MVQTARCLYLPVPFFFTFFVFTFIPSTKIQPECPLNWATPFLQNGLLHVTVVTSSLPQSEVTCQIFQPHTHKYGKVWIFKLVSHPCSERFLSRYCKSHHSWLKSSSPPDYYRYPLPWPTGWLVNKHPFSNRRGLPSSSLSLIVGEQKPLFISTGGRTVYYFLFSHFIYIDVKMQF